MATADSPTKTCGEGGCGRPLRARGLCSTHYNQRQPNRHTKVTLPCGWCNAPCLKDKGREKRYGGLFCSYPCREAWRAATGNNPAPSAEPRAWPHPRRRSGDAEPTDAIKRS